jgi:hypothetical protein
MRATVYVVCRAAILAAYAKALYRLTVTWEGLFTWARQNRSV